MRKFFNKKNIIIVSWLLLIYVLLLVIYGYILGHNNGIQLMPFVQYLNDGSLFSKDFFIQNANKNFPNERSIFLLLLQPFGNALEYGAFIEYSIFNLFLLLGLFKIARFIFKNNTYAYAAIVLMFFPLQYHSIGLSELFGNDFTSSIASDTMAVWAIYAWIKGKQLRCYLLLILSTLFHPLGGFLIFFLISGAILIQAILNKNLIAFAKKTIPLIVAYCLTAGVFIYALYNRLNDVSVDSAAFFQIFFVFRNAHHFIPSHFVLRDVILLSPVYLLTPYFLYKHNKNLALLSLLIVIGCLIYVPAVEFGKMVLFAESQWFKTTGFLKFFAVIGVLLVIQKIIPYLQNGKHAKQFLTLVIIGSTFWVMFIFPGFSIIKSQTPYEFPFYKKLTPEIEISELAKQNTDINALFIVPCSFDELKYYGQRSTYVDFKAITHSKSFIMEWAARFEDIYGMDALTSQVVSFDAIRLGDENYNKISSERFLELKNTKGITHIIVDKSRKLPFTMVASNSDYTIYAL